MNQPMMKDTKAVKPPKSMISMPEAYHVWMVKALLRAPSTKSMASVSPHEIPNSTRSSNSLPTVQAYASSGNTPKSTKEQKVTRPSNHGLSSGSGTMSSSSSVIILSTKKSSYLAMVRTTI